MSSQLTPEQVSRIRRLTQAVYHEQASLEESDELRQWIQLSSEAAWIYAQYMHLFASLHWDKMQEPLPSSPTPKPLIPNPSPLLGYVADAFHATTDFFSRSFVLTLLLTIILPGVIFLVLAVHVAQTPVAQAPVNQQPTQVVPARVAVAEITNMHQCKWDSNIDRAVAPTLGTKLYPGKELQLEAGLVELTYRKGTKLLLQGPARFKIKDNNSGFLNSGMLTADVPLPAHGFTIQTPVATVVDLGTEFGVSVDDGTSEVQVFKGKIEVGPCTNPHNKTPNASHEFEKLDVGQAARISAVGAGQIEVKKIAAVSKRFARRLPAESTADLPEPTILFAHRGDRDPSTEGWRPVNLAVNRKDARGQKQIKAGPIRDEKTEAWSIVDDSQKHNLRYVIDDENGLTPELRAEARAKGWVFRARFSVIGQKPETSGIGFCSYWEDNRQWRLRCTVGANGNQCLLLLGESSLGEDVTITIPNSRGRFVDYEVRYHPETDDADVYIDGQFAATLSVKKTQGGACVFQFGTLEEGAAEVQYEQVEWGIIRRK